MGTYKYTGDQERVFTGIQFDDGRGCLVAPGDIVAFDVLPVGLEHYFEAAQAPSDANVPTCVVADGYSFGPTPLEVEEPSEPEPAPQVTATKSTPPADSKPDAPAAEDKPADPAAATA